MTPEQELGLWNRECMRADQRCSSDDFLLRSPEPLSPEFNVWDEEGSTDLTVYCGSHTYRMNAAILGSRSSFFDYYGSEIQESTEGKYCRVESDDWHGIGNLFEWIHTGRCTFSSSLAHFPKEINATPTVDVDVNGSTNVDTSPAVSVVEEVPKPEAEPSKKQVSGESQCSVAMSSQSSICRMPVQFPQCLHHYISVYHAARKFCVPSLQIYALALLRARLSQDSRFGLTFPLDLRFAIKRSWTSDGSICIGEVDTELRTTLISVMFTWCSLLFSETVPAEVSVEIAEVVEWALGPGAGDFGTCFWASVISGKVERLEKGKGKDGEREDDCRTNVWVRENRAVKDELAWKVKEVEAMSRDGMAMEEAIIKSDLSVDEARVTGLL